MDKIKHPVQLKALNHIQKNKHYLNFEQWKYTDIKQFNSLNINYNPTTKLNNINCNDYEIILHNGLIHAIGNKINKNILILNTTEAFKKNIANCKNLFNSIISFNKDIAIAYNTSFLNYGFLLHINKNTNIQHPITNRHYIDDGCNNSFLNLRNIIIVE